MLWRGRSEMRRLIYTVQMRGRTSGTPQSMRTTGSAASCALKTAISPSGVESELELSAGGFAFFESELQRTGPTQYLESGEITFGEPASHALRFSTASPGHFADGFEPHTIAGTASWRVESGTGQFAGARGFITSNFTLTSRGDRCDFLCGVLFLPD